LEAREGQEDRKGFHEMKGWGTSGALVQKPASIRQKRVRLPNRQRGRGGLEAGPEGPALAWTTTQKRKLKRGVMRS